MRRTGLFYNSKYKINTFNLQRNSLCNKGFNVKKYYKTKQSDYLKFNLKKK